MSLFYWKLWFVPKTKENVEDHLVCLHFVGMYWIYLRYLSNFSKYRIIQDRILIYLQLSLQRIVVDRMKKLFVAHIVIILAGLIIYNVLFKISYARKDVVASQATLEARAEHVLKRIHLSALHYIRPVDINRLSAITLDIR